MADLFLKKWDKVVIVYDAPQQKVLDFDMDSPEKMMQLAQVLEFEPGRVVVRLMASPLKERVILIAGDQNIGRKIRFIAHG